jgi:hypothetical protein
MKALLAFGRLAHNPQSILAAIGRLALVCVKLYLNALAFELGVASFADAKGRSTRLHDPQFAFCHDPSLAHVAGEA